jgi:protease-4
VRADRVLAVILIALTFIAAIGSWVMRPKTTAGLDLGSSASVLGAGTADVAVFDLIGTISNGSGEDMFGSEKGISATRVVPLLRAAEQDGVKAILLRINSPGGTAAASQAIYDELMRIRKTGKIKIVAAFGDVSASGGYYIAAAADHIVALPSTTTGSIGVIAHVPNMQGLLGKVGVRDIVFKSGKHKDILSPSRDVSPEEAAIIQGIVNDTYQQFLEAVSGGRPKQLPMAKLRPLADGRIFTGRQAKTAGLVDSLGNFEDALKKTADLAGIEGTPETKDYTEQSLWDSILKLQGRLGAKVQVDFGTPLAVRYPARLPLALME